MKNLMKTLAVAFATLCVVAVSIINAQAQCSVSAHYPFTATSTEDYVGTDDATNSGADPTTDQYGTTDGAYTFNGTSDKMTATTNTLGNWGTGNFSISYWLNTTYSGGTNGSQIALSKRNSCTGSTSHWQTGTNSSGYPFFGIRQQTPSSAIGITCSTAVNDGQWHHIAITRSGTTVTIYVDCVACTTGTAAQNPNTTGYLTIGNVVCSAFGDPFSGKLDEIKLYTGCALSATEVCCLADDQVNYVLKADEGCDPVSSIIFDNGSNVGIGTHTPQHKLTVFDNSSQATFTLPTFPTVQASIAGGFTSANPASAIEVGVGVVGQSSLGSLANIGVVGITTDAAATNCYGGWFLGGGSASSTTRYGVRSLASGSTGYNYGISGVADNTTTVTTVSNIGVHGVAEGANKRNVGVTGYAKEGTEGNVGVEGIVVAADAPGDPSNKGLLTNMGVSGIAGGSLRANYGLFGQSDFVPDPNTLAGVCGLTNVGVQGNASGSPFENRAGSFTTKDASATNYDYSVWARSTSDNPGSAHWGWGGAPRNYAGYYLGDVFVSGSIINVSELPNFMTGATPTHLDDDVSLDIVMDLEPKRYESNYDRFDHSLSGDFAHLGFSPDNVEDALTDNSLDADIVREIKTLSYKPDDCVEASSPDIDKKAISYNEIIPLLVSAIQKLNSKIDNLEAELDTCCQSSSKLAGPSGGTGTHSNLSVELSSAQIIVLEQNVPNPFNESTSISYFIPEETTSAQIVFTNMKGTTIKTVDLEKGDGTITVFAQSLSSGTYSYTLIVDGKAIETKRMVKTTK